MIPIEHPINKTKTDLRRSITRMSIFVKQEPNHPAIEEIKQAIQQMKHASKILLNVEVKSDD